MKSYCLDNLDAIFSNKYRVKAVSIFDYNFILINNSNIIFRRSYFGIIPAINFYWRQERDLVKYFKMLYILFSSIIGLSNSVTTCISSNVKSINFVIIGKSSRIKIFSKKRILNLFPSSDKYAQKDMYIRRKVNNLGISPKVIRFSNGSYEEVNLRRLKYNKIEFNLLRKDCLLPLYSIFPYVFIDADLYLQKMLKKISKYSSTNKYSELSIQGRIKVRMSHGDLHPLNVLTDVTGRLHLIDYEFSNYRSKFYDELYWNYYEKGLKSLEKISIPREYKYFFCLERIYLCLSLQDTYKKNYSEEIKKIERWLVINS
jgi:thiamine kinase-like enzyme